jgi:uncharacterized protein YceK
MKFPKCIVFLLVLTFTAILIAGCTTTTTIGNPAPAQPATSASAAVAAPAQAPASAGTPSVPAAESLSATASCPDKEVLTGTWDSREVGYASNHDVREENVWTDASPVPVTLTQKCWDASGTFHTGDCNGKLTGKIEKNIFSGTWTNECTTTVDNAKGTFSVTMAADNQSFMGSMYKTCEGCYGPENGFPPSWWAKKTA